MLFRTVDASLATLNSTFPGSFFFQNVPIYLQSIAFFLSRVKHDAYTI